MKHRAILFSLLFLTMSPSLAAMQSSLPTYLLAGGAATVGAYLAHKKIRQTDDRIPSPEQMNMVALTPVIPRNINDMVWDSPANKTGKFKTLKDAVRHIKHLKTGTNIRINKPNPLDQGIRCIIKGIPADTVFGDILLYSKGVSDQTCGPLERACGATGTPRDGGGLLEAYLYEKRNIISPAARIVTFDYPDTQGFMDIGGRKETECLRSVYHEIATKNPQVKINMLGLCRGGKTVLELATQNPKNLATMVVESPLLSFARSADQMGKGHVPWMPFAGAQVYAFFRYLLPSYKPQEDNLLERIGNIPAHVPILIGHLKGDTDIPEAPLRAMLQTLKDRDNVYLCVIADRTKKVTHGTLSKAKPFQYACNLFWAKYGQTHIPEFARCPRILEIAQENAQRAPHEWVAVENI